MAEKRAMDIVTGRIELLTAQRQQVVAQGKDLSDQLRAGQEKLRQLQQLIGRLDGAVAALQATKQDLESGGGHAKGFTSGDQGDCEESPDDAERPGIIPLPTRGS